MAIVNGVEVKNDLGEVEVCEALHISESRNYAVIASRPYSDEFRVVLVPQMVLVCIDRRGLGLGVRQGLSWEQALDQIASLEGKA